MSTGSNDEVREPRPQPAPSLDTTLRPRTRSESPERNIAPRPRQRSPLPQASEGAATNPPPTPLSTLAEQRLDRILGDAIAFKSMRQAPKNTIRSRLESLPADNHLALLNGLRAELSGKRQEDIPAAVDKWAGQVSADTIVRPSEDLRSPAAKARAERLLQARSNPDFERKIDEISGLFTSATKNRLNLRSTSVAKGKYQSPMFRKFMDLPEVVQDPRAGGVRLIADLHAQLAAAQRDQRETVLEQWVPPPAPLQSPSQPAAQPSIAGSSTSAAAATTDTGAKKDFQITYYRNFGTNTDEWRGAWSQVKAGRVDETTFNHPQANESQPSEHALAVKSLHVKKQIGGEGHWSLFVETEPDSRMIKLDFVKNGYRVYVDAKPDVGFETETFNVLPSDNEKLKVKDIYATMSKVAGEIGDWGDTEETNCRGFVNSMIGDLSSSLSDPTRPTQRQRTQPDRFDPAAP